MTYVVYEPVVPNVFRQTSKSLKARHRADLNSFRTQLFAAAAFAVCSGSAYAATSPPTCTLSGSVGQAFSMDLGTACANNSSINSCSLVQGSIPFAPGINSLSGCVLSGTPTQSGIFTGDIMQVGAAEYSLQFCISASCGVTILSPFLLTPSADLGDIELATILPSISNLTSVAATGLSADGTSAAIVLIQTTTTDPVTFTTNNGTTLLQYDPKFLTYAPLPGNSTLTVTPIPIGSLLYAVALLQAPPAIVVPNYGTPITITAQQDGGQIQQAYLPLVPPPVVLVHGIWGTIKSLSNVKSYLTSVQPWQSQPKFVMPIAYTNDIPFDSDEPLSASNPLGNGSSALGHAINRLLSNMQSQGIVAGRVDVVAHSMGGLVARHYSSLPEYKTFFDRMEGRFQEIITIDTPETGTSLAFYLYNHAMDYFHSNKSAADPKSSNSIAGAVWDKACGSEAVTMTVENCFAGSVLHDPLYPAGMTLKDGAVYSLIPESSNLNGLPAANIPNALWLAASAVRPQMGSESTLQFELEELIAATYEKASSAQSLSEIMMDNGQDDVIVPLASQVATAHAGQFAMVPGLAHSPAADPGFFERKFGSLSPANVEDSAPMNALVSCWLQTYGGSGCSAKSSVRWLSSAEAAETQPVTVNRNEGNLAIEFPSDVSLAAPFEVALRAQKALVGTVSVHQRDTLGHFDDNDVKITRVENGVAYIKITPVFLGEVTFELDGTLQDGGYAEGTHKTIVKLPTVPPQVFYSDADHFETDYLSLAKGGNEGRLHPTAVWATAPEKEIDLDGWVKYSLVPAPGAPVIQLSGNGSYTALREGMATLELRFGQEVTRVTVVVRDDGGH